jgi:hypothetical protein
MIRIRFTERAAKRRALQFLLGRFSFKSWKTGEMIVPEAALAEMAREGITYVVEGPATYAEQIAAFRNPAAAAV